MKKFSKTCLITASIMLVCGILICTVCGLIAGPQLRDINSDFWQNMTYEVNFGSNWTPFSDDHSFSSHNGFYDEYPIYDESHSNEKVASAKEIDHLDFDINYGYVNIVKSDDEYFHINYKGNGHLQYFVESGTLNIIGFYKPHESRNHVKDKLTLAIPEKQKFDNVDITCDAGAIEIKELEANLLDMSLNAASACLDTVTVQNACLDANAASLEFADSKISDLSLEMNAGSMEYKGDILTSASISINAGSVEFVLDGKEKDYNYELDCAMGSISIGRNSYDGLSASRSLDNGADTFFDIYCSMGSIDIQFH